MKNEVEISEAETIDACLDLAATDRHSARTRRKRGNGSKASAVRYRMRCPRCGLGLIEILPGPAAQGKCTACGHVWHDAKELLQIAKQDTTGVFQWFE